MSNGAESAETKHVYHGVEGVLTIAMAVSGLVLSKRIDQCSPPETKQESQERKAIFALSIITLVLVVLKCAAEHFDRLKSIAPALHVLYNLIAFVLAILNISYISKVKTEPCSGSGVAPTDSLSNKNLALGVLVLAAVVLVLIVKRGVYQLSRKYGKKK